MLQTGSTIFFRQRGKRRIKSGIVMVVFFWLIQSDALTLDPRMRFERFNFFSNPDA